MGDLESVVVAVDLGATSIKGALVDHVGHRVFELQVPTDRERGPGAVLGRLVETVAKLVDRASALLLVSEAIAVAACGVVDAANFLVTSVNLGWQRVEVASALATKTKLKVTLVNDAHAGAIGEGRLGAARDHDDFLYVALGTGIGAAIIQGGRPVRGAHNHSGELGHMRISSTGATCACGAVGCLETWMSAPAVQSRFLAATGVDQAPSADRIVELAVAGDPVAVAVWNDAIDALAFGLLNATMLLDPGAIVVGGGMSLAGAALFDRLRERFSQRASSFQVLPEIRQAELGPWSGCVGASLIAWQNLKETLAAQRVGGAAG